MRNNILNFILFSLSLSVPESDVLAKIDVDELYSDVRRAQKATKRYPLSICDSTLIIIICMYVFYFRQSKNKSAISYDYDHQQGSAGGTKREREDELSDESDNGNTHTLTLLF